MSERKLYRPPTNLNPLKKPKEEKRDETNKETQNPAPQKHKQPPPEQTHAENYYYNKQINHKTDVIVVLIDGEEIRGKIEWYDKNCIKVHTPHEQNYMIFKHAIKYITKEKQQ